MERRPLPGPRPDIMKTLPLLLAAVVLALGLAWWWRAEDPRDDAAIAPATATPAVEARTPVLQSPPQLQRSQVPDQPAKPAPAKVPAPVALPATPGVPSYEQWTLEDLIRERKTLGDTLTESTQPLLDAEIDAGRAEFLGEPGTPYPSRPGDNGEIFSVVSIPDRGVYRPSLARDQHPDLYALKDRLVRVNQLVRAREHAPPAPR